MELDETTFFRNRANQKQASAVGKYFGATESSNFD